MTKISFKKKIKLIILSIIFTIIFIEMILRLSGCIVLWFREYRNKIGSGKDTYLIMCLGESTTACGGKHSYPFQLEDILNTNSKEKKFKVINKGIDGIESPDILAKCKENIKMYQPDMVIAMMGINDGSGTILYKDTLRMKFMLFVKNIRVYTLARAIYLNIVNKFDYHDYGYEKVVEAESEKIIDDFKNPHTKYHKKYIIYRNEEDFRGAEEFLKKILEEHPYMAGLYVDLGETYNIQGKFKEGELILEKAMEMDPMAERVYEQLGYSCIEQTKYDKAEKILRKGLKIFKDRILIYAELYRCYIQQNDIEKLKDLCEIIIKGNPNEGSLLGFAANIYREIGDYKEAKKYYKKANKYRLKYFNAVTKYNLNKLEEILRERGIKLICVQYPMLNIESLKLMMDNREKVVFVDNERLFKDAVKQGKYEDYFSDSFGGEFGHCTPKGNNLLAGNIASVILKQFVNNVIIK